MTPTTKNKALAIRSICTLPVLFGSALQSPIRLGLGCVVGR